MHFIGLDTSAQCGIDLLMPLNQALAFKAAGHNSGIPMLAVARQLDVLARQAAGDNGLEFFAGHINKLASDFVAGTQHVDGNRTHDD